MTEPLGFDQWKLDPEVALSQMRGWVAGEHPLLSGLYPGKFDGRTTPLSQMSPLLRGLSQPSCYLPFEGGDSIFLSPLSFIWPCCSPTLVILKPKP